MAKSKEAFGQIGFAQGGGEELLVPEHISEIVFGPEILNVVPTAETWQKRPVRGALLVLNLDENKAYSVRADNWTVIATHEITENAYPKNYFSVVVIVFPSGINLTSGERFVSAIEKNWFALKGESLGFVLEASPADTKKDWRGELLRKAGFVKSELKVEKAGGILVWQTRLPLEHKSFEVDMLAKEPQWRHKLMQEKWLKMAADYRRQGFEVIKDDKAAILERLRHSKFPPQDISLLETGCGVRLRNLNCGCEWNIDMKGNWDRYKNCPDEICNGTSRAEPKPLVAGVVYVLGRLVETEIPCFDCGRKFVQEVQKIKSLGKTEALIEIESYCPNCVSPEGHYKKRIRVRASQLQS